MYISALAIQLRMTHFKPQHKRYVQIELLENYRLDLLLIQIGISTYCQVKQTTLTKLNYQCEAKPRVI